MVAILGGVNVEDWINRDVHLSFEPDGILKNLMEMAEKANDEGNWGYFNLADSIDIICKNLYADGKLTKHDWDTAVQRYLDFN